MSAHFTDSEWIKINALYNQSAHDYGLPKSRNDSVIIGSFNIRKLGAVSKRTEQSWNLLKDILKNFDLLKEMKQNAKYEYRLTKLSDCKGDISKLWYANFWAWSVDDGKMIRKRLYEINKFETAAERKKYANKQIKEINQLLISGFHFDDV